MWLNESLNVLLNLPCLIFFPIHKNDNNYTCHLSTSGDQGRINEMSVKGFELSSVKLLWLYKAQSSILSVYFSWHLPQSLKSFAPHWLLPLPGSPPFCCLSELLERSARLLLFLTLVLGDFFPTWTEYLKISSPDACFAVHVRLLCRHGSMGQQEETMWDASLLTFQDDTLIVGIYCFRAHLESYKMSPTIVKEKTALPRRSFVTSKCF